MPTTNAHKVSLRNGVHTCTPNETSKYITAFVLRCQSLPKQTIFIYTPYDTLIPPKYVIAKKYVVLSRR